MAIDTLDKVVAALSGGQRLPFLKASATAEGAGTWHSLWKLAGKPPAGSNPGSLAGVIPTEDTTGALHFVLPTGGMFTHLVRAAASGATAGTLILYDRLWANSGMSGTQTGVDTTLGATPSLTRPDANGDYTELWGEIYSAIGASTTTLNVRYTNQAGTALQQATYAHPANAEAIGQMFPLVLASGDTGVQRATAYHWSSTTGTIGDFGLTIMRRIAEIPITVANAGTVLDFAGTGMPRIYDNACLALMVMCSTTNTGFMQGAMTLGQG